MQPCSCQSGLSQTEEKEKDDRSKTTILTSKPSMTAFNQVSLKPSNQPAMIGSKRHSSSSYFRLSLKDDYKHLWTSSYIQEARKRGMGVPLFLSLIKARFGQLRCSSNCTPTVKGTPIGGSEKSTKPRSTPSNTSTQTQPRADQRLEIRSN